MNADASRAVAAKAGAALARGLARSGRLLKHSDFDRVYKQGRRHFSPHMTVFYLPRMEDDSTNGVLAEDASRARVPSDKSARVGFTVGKVLGGAVVRNRIKRRLREAVRLRRALLDGAVDVVGVDVVINPKKTVLTLEFSVVLEEVGRALETVSKKLVHK